MKVIIVGGVAGGASCAPRLRRLDEKIEILMVERGPFVSYANCGLPYHVGGSIENESSLLVATEQMFKAVFAIDCRTNCEVVGIDAKAKTVKLKNHITGEITTEKYDKLVLSPGAAPIRPPLPGIDLPGIFSVRTVADAKNIREWLERNIDRSVGNSFTGVDTVSKPKHAVVIGGGFIGLEMDENLIERGLSVVLLEKLDQVMPPLDPEMANLVKRYLKKHDVKVKTGDGVAGFRKSENGEIEVLTEKGKVHPAEVVIMAIGVKPETELAKMAGIDSFAMAIQMGCTIYDLEESKLCYAPPYGSAKDPVNFAGMVAADVLHGDMPIVHWDSQGEDKDTVMKSSYLNIKRNNKVRFIGIILLLLISALSYGQDSSNVSAKKEKKFRFLPLPAFAVTPTTGWMLGLAPGAYWMMGDKSNTSLSSALGTLIFTQKKQVLITAKANTFFKGDKWNMLTDIRYFINSQPTYGLGTGPQSAKPVGTGGVDFNGKPYQAIETSQMMEFNYLRVHNTLMKRYEDSRFFFGLGYHLDYHDKINDNLLNLDTIPQIITSHYGYSTIKGFDPTEYWLSGVSFNFLYDSRDNAVNPYSGRYAFANIRINPEFLGSTKSSSILWLEYRDYLHLSKTRPRHLIGLWTYGWFQTSGTVPYMDLPAVGWDQFGRSGRAYTQGRFRGQDLIYTELEYRVPLQRNKETFGAVAFINGTTASNRDANISLYEYLDIGYGIGLRVMVMKKSRANLSIDYAWGKYGAQGFYFGLNEVF